MSKEVTESRRIRSIILDILSATSGQSGVAFGVSLEQLRAGFSRTRVPVNPDNLLSALRYLVGDGLAASEWDKQLGDEFYSITPQGADFKRAGYPWEDLDRFSGQQPA